MKKPWENERTDRMFGNGASNGNGAAAERDEISIGDLFRSLGQDAGHLVQQEIALAKAELSESANRIGQAASKLAVAAIIALSGMMAFTAFMAIVIGNALNNYWLGALITSVVLLAIAGITARGAMSAVRQKPLGAPETAETLREDAQWARKELQEVKRELSA